MLSQKKGSRWVILSKLSCLILGIATTNDVCPCCNREASSVQSRTLETIGNVICLCLLGAASCYLCGSPSTGFETRSISGPIGCSGVSRWRRGACDRWACCSVTLQMRLLARDNANRSSLANRSGHSLRSESRPFLFITQLRCFLRLCVNKVSRP